MIFTSIRAPLAALVMGLGAIAGSSLQAAPYMAKSHTQQFVKPAQVYVSATDTITPVLSRRIHFTKTNLHENIKIKKHKSVFEVEVPGLYDITAFTLVNPPNLGDSVTIAFLINGKSYNNFINQEIVSNDTLPIVTQRDIYLKKGDKLTVVLKDAPAGTTISSRGFSMVVRNNTK